MDIYFKKEISYLFGKNEFKFDVAQTLFSTFDIDHGTDILIRTVVPNNPKDISYIRTRSATLTTFKL